MELYPDIESIKTLNEIKEYLLFIAWTALWVCTLSNADYQKKNSANSPNRLDVEEGKPPKTRGGLWLWYEYITTEVNSYELSGTELNLTEPLGDSQPLVLKLIPRIFEYLSNSLKGVISGLDSGSPSLSAVREGLYIQGSDIRKFIITEVWKAALTDGAIMTTIDLNPRLDLTYIIFKAILPTKTGDKYVVNEQIVSRLPLELAFFMRSETLRMKAVEDGEFY
ncbi:MAG: hypothetical protein H7230_02870 [Candidatus Parcubacteria bacterium]|nr:hypothetical protein [Candidatus Paceibacterota bacterium]